MGTAPATLILSARRTSNIPLAALAAILFVVAWNMSEPKRFTDVLRKAPTADRVILIITFALTVFADLVVAVNVGVILAVLQFLRRMAETTEAQPMTTRALKLELLELGVSELPSSIVVYEIAGPLFFAAVENFRRPLLETRPFPKVLIIRLDRVPFMDITGIQTLEDVMANLRRRGVIVMLCGANPRVFAKLQAAGLFSNDAPASHSESLRDALVRAGVGGAGRTPEQ